MIHKKYLGEFYIWSYIFYVFSLLLIYIRNVLPKFIELCMETPSAVWRRHPDELQHGGRKPTETSVTEFCYESAISRNSVSNTVTVQTVKSPQKITL